MTRRSQALITAAAILAVAASVAAILWAGLGIAWSYAALAAIAAGVLLVWLASRSRRASGEDEMRRRLEGVEQAVCVVQRRQEDLAGRLDILDQRLVDTGRVTVQAVAAELDSLGRVVRELAEAVATHDQELFAAPRQPAPAAPRDMRAAPASVPAHSGSPADAGRADSPAIVPETAPARRAAAARSDTAATADAIVRAIVSDRLALFLHPIVGLPHRRVQYYELVGRVPRPGLAGHAEPAEIAAVAARHGLLARLETLLVRDALRIARHLRSRGRDVPLMVPVSLTSIADPALFEEVSEALRADPSLAPGIAFQVEAEAWREAGGFDAKAVEALRRLGIRFALDGVSDLRLDPGELSRRGVSHVRVGAGVLAAAAEGSVPSEIHPYDVPGLLARQGVEMIVTGIDSERSLVELFDFGLALGQGELFSGPRAVRPEVLAAEPPAAVSSPVEPPPAPATTIVEAAPQAPQRTSLRSVLRRSGS